MGHAYGLNHSRKDGSDQDYMDPWDVMSTFNAYSADDIHYVKRGPGLSACNMRASLAGLMNSGSGEVHLYHPV